MELFQQKEQQVVQVENFLVICNILNILKSSKLIGAKLQSFLELYQIPTGFLTDKEKLFYNFFRWAKKNLK